MATVPHPEVRKAAFQKSKRVTVAELYADKSYGHLQTAANRKLTERYNSVDSLGAPSDPYIVEKVDEVMLNRCGVGGNKEQDGLTPLEIAVFLKKKFSVRLEKWKIRAPTSTKSPTGDPEEKREHYSLLNEVRQCLIQGCDGDNPKYRKVNDCAFTLVQPLEEVKE